MSRYFRRLPALLRNSLTVEYSYYDLRDALRRYRTTTFDARDDAMWEIVHRLREVANHRGLLYLTRNVRMSSNISSFIYDFACEYGVSSIVTPDMKRYLSHQAQSLASKYQHYDLIKIAYDHSPHPTPSADRLFASSLLALAYMKDRYPKAVPKGLYLFQAAVDNCYEFGFDPELLEYASAGVSEPDVEVFAKIRVDVTQSSASETLRYLVAKYPGANYGRYSTRYLLNGVMRRIYEKTMKEMSDILVAAGCGP